MHYSCRCTADVQQLSYSKQMSAVQTSTNHFMSRRHKQLIKCSYFYSSSCFNFFVLELFIICEQNWDFCTFFPQNINTFKDSGPKSCQYLSQKVSALFFSVFPAWLVVTLICVTTKLPPPKSPSITVFGRCLLCHVEGKKDPKQDQRRRPGQGPTYVSLAVVNNIPSAGPTSVNIILTASSCPLVAPVPEFLT